MTNTELPDENYASQLGHPADYETDSLPLWVQEVWWTGANSKGSRGSAYWASLDVQLAYPSVRLKGLSKALHDLIGTADILSKFTLATTGQDRLLDGYPQVLLVGLRDRQQRTELSDGLVTALERVNIADGGIPVESWKPFHARAKLPPKNIGLPTGLAVSGLLLNVVMHRADQAVFNYLVDARAKHRGAVVRFADDMYLMARSSKGLFRLIDVVWGAVEGTASNYPIKPRAKSNLHINLSKVNPAPVREAVYRCLRASGWSECPCPECDEMEPGSQAASLRQWWPDGADETLRSDLIGTAIAQKDVGPFVTTLVERLSEIGKDTLTDRFGQGARDRQVHLHDLARFDIADEQVRPDTRRTFAANRLAGTWLSTDPIKARRELSEIRRSVATVFAETPWKFALWRAIVRSAARRVTDAASHRAGDDMEAKNWLSGLLEHVSIHGRNSLDVQLARGKCRAASSRFDGLAKTLSLISPHRVLAIFGGCHPATLFTP